RQRRYMLVQQVDQQACHPRFRLTALPEKDDVLTAEDGVLDLWNDCFFVADDTGEQRLSRAQARDEIVAHLLLNRLDLIAALPQLPHRARARHPAVASFRLPGPP